MFHVSCFMFRTCYNPSPLCVHRVPMLNPRLNPTFAGVEQFLTPWPDKESWDVDYINTRSVDVTDLPELLGLDCYVSSTGNTFIRDMMNARPSRMLGWGCVLVCQSLIIGLSPEDAHHRQAIHEFLYDFCGVYISLNESAASSAWAFSLKHLKIATSHLTEALIYLKIRTVYMYEYGTKQPVSWIRQFLGNRPGFFDIGAYLTFAPRPTPPETLDSFARRDLLIPVVDLIHSTVPRDGKWCISSMAKLNGEPMGGATIQHTCSDGEVRTLLFYPALYHVLSVEVGKANIIKVDCTVEGANTRVTKLRRYRDFANRKPSHISRLRVELRGFFDNITHAVNELECILGDGGIVMCAGLIVIGGCPFESYFNRMNRMLRALPPRPFPGRDTVTCTIDQSTMSAWLLNICGMCLKLKQKHVLSGDVQKWVQRNYHFNLNTSIHVVDVQEVVMNVALPGPDAAHARGVVRLDVGAVVDFLVEYQFEETEADFGPWLMMRAPPPAPPAVSQIGSDICKPRLGGALVGGTNHRNDEGLVLARMKNSSPFGGCW
eukprot:GHVU01036156.1.p1 GENE.GHVU01036156.1~~GHVU01036156.1.p1  ORF type:complete len:546 (+),score=35.28 GHVU01036156.1:1475-3112(+)